MRISIRIALKRATKEDLVMYENRYPWISELSRRNKRRCVSEIKKFEDLGIAAPMGIISRRYRK